MVPGSAGVSLPQSPAPVAWGLKIGRPFPCPFSGPDRKPPFSWREPWPSQRRFSDEDRRYLYHRPDGWGSRRRQLNRRCRWSRLHLVVPEIVRIRGTRRSIRGGKSGSDGRLPQPGPLLHKMAARGRGFSQVEGGRQQATGLRITAGEPAAGDALLRRSSGPKRGRVDKKSAVITGSPMAHAGLLGASGPA
jgi:hypothetical protein